MAATELFETFISSLTESERNYIGRYVSAQREDLLAARSEDARLRIVREFIDEVRRLLKQTRR